MAKVESTSQIFQVSLDTSSFAFTPGGSVTGKLHLVLGDSNFPESPWIDFPLPILQWWSNSICNTIEFQDAMEFEFMDGPALVRGVRKKDDRIRLQAFFNDTLECEGEFFLHCVGKEILGASKELLLHFDRCKSMPDKHADYFVETLNSLRNECSRLERILENLTQ